MTAQQRLSSLLPPSHASIGALLSTQGVKSVASLLSADRTSLDGVEFGTLVQEVRRVRRQE